MAYHEFRENMFEITGGEAANKRLLGLASGAVESVQKAGFSLAMSFEQAKAENAERERQSTSEIIYLTLLEQLNGQIDRLSGEIAKAEGGFTDEYGEDWREQFAQRALEPDEIPQRREGESMEAYRERLEQALIDKMLDENGDIKPEYMNDPEMRRWAEWAQKEYDERAAKAYADAMRDPAISQVGKDRMTEEFGESATWQRLEQMRIHSKGIVPDADAKATEAKDNLEDQRLNSTPPKSADNSFLS